MRGVHKRLLRSGRAASPVDLINLESLSLALMLLYATQVLKVIVCSPVIALKKVFLPYMYIPDSRWLFICAIPVGIEVAAAQTSKHR